MEDHYFVTNVGLAAGVKDPKILHNLEEILNGRARRAVVDDYLAAGYIGAERRPAPIDNNALVLQGIVQRVQEALNGDCGNKPADGKAKHNGEAELDSSLMDLRTVPKKLYRLRAAPASQTAEQLRRLPSGARRVYVALQRVDVGTTKSLAEATQLNRRTVENALIALRKAGLLDDINIER